MKKIGNKFIILVFLLIIFIISFGIYMSYFSGIDRSTFVVLLKGKGLLNEKDLKIEEKEKLKNGDIVKTIGKNSLAVIEWGDGSLTRLGGDSSIKIDNIYVDDDLLKINISFKLLSGKSWSNVINYMGEGSYFNESFRDIEAGVRGTVFNVDLDNDYVSVAKHKISLTKNDGKSYKIEENKPFSIKTFSFIDLQEFITKIKDKAFEDLNIKFDKEYLNNLKIKLQSNITKFGEIGKIDINALTSGDKQELYNELLSKYQELNFISSSDSEELFNKKLDYKKTLISLSGEEEKKVLIENTLIDFEDTISTNNVSGFEQVIGILNENSNVVKSLNVNFADYFKGNSVPEGLKDSLNRNIEILQNIFGGNIKEKISSLKLLDLESIKNITQDKIEENLNNTITLKNKIKQFLEGFFKKN